MGPAKEMEGFLEGRNILRSLGSAIFLMEKWNKKSSSLKIRIEIPVSHELPEYIELFAR
jgi:hypothetical protein